MMFYCLPFTRKNISTKSMSMNKEMERELSALYKRWPEVRKYLKLLGCERVEAEDIFQEALLIYSRKRQTPDFELTVDAFFYVKNTCKLIWYNSARKVQRRGGPALEITDVPEVQDPWMEKEMKLSAAEKAVSMLGKQCQELIELFYVKKWSMQAIAEKVGLRNEKVAKVQKYRCLQKAKELVQENGVPQLVQLND